jgi:glycosyltransferase involved in cell wall biosynthesis
MRILFVLPGFHRYDRGAEVALSSVAQELAKQGDSVTLIGGGDERPGKAYRFARAALVPRERFEGFPFFPGLRSETAWEEASFVPGLLRAYDPTAYDVTVTCSYPFTNWVLNRRTSGRKRPAHVFVTQNGDWPAQSNRSEYRFFGCDGLVCTNPDFFERNRPLWRCALIPNGIDTARFIPGAASRERFGLPADRPVILMVSALISTKRVADGIRAASMIPDAHLVVAGDGPLREEIDRLAAERLAGRFSRVSIGAAEMPDLYRSADIFLHMSIEESFGNVFVEAMACGLPIVGHDSARLRWIVGDGEYLADTTDQPRLVAAISAALAGARESGDSRVERSRRFAWSHIAEDYRKFFSDILTADAGTRGRR